MLMMKMKALVAQSRCILTAAQFRILVRCCWKLKVLYKHAFVSMMTMTEVVKIRCVPLQRMRQATVSHRTCLSFAV
jgi:hypothetical protein